jgi:hypothetical protein
MTVGLWSPARTRKIGIVLIDIGEVIIDGLGA